MVAWLTPAGAPVLPRLDLGGESTRRLTDQLLLLGPGAAGTRLRDALRDRSVHTVACVVSRGPERAGLLERIARQALCDVSIVATVSDVRSGAPLTDIEQAAARIGPLRPDAIVAIGGGSVIDSAKCLALSIAVGEIGPFLIGTDAEGQPVHPVLPPIEIPVVAVPTTLSGAEVTPSAGVTDPSGAKRFVRGPQLAAAIICADPDVLATTPQPVLVATAMMALSHCLESLYSTSANALSSATALLGAESLARGLTLLAGAPFGDLFEALAVGSVLAGIAIGGTSSGLQHAVCHVLGATRDGPSQAQAHAIMLTHVMRFNMPATSVAQVRFAASVACGAGEPFVDPSDLIRRLRDRAGAPAHLSAFGLKRSELRTVARHTLHEPGARQNPRPISSEVEILDLLEAAW
ncbi:MAG: iron-containing alcohol dehydrogenase family protein [Candidatus Limnocylindrales bacterium]